MHKNKNKNKTNLTVYKNKNTLDNKILTSNIDTLNQEKIFNNELSVHHRHNKIKDNDYKDLTKIVRNSVEKINNLFNQTEFQSKRHFQKASQEISRYEEINKSNEKEKERANTLQKSSKANFTFNINNFINVPNFSTTLPNMSQEKNNIENNDKNNLGNSKSNKKKIYLNSINNKKNLLIENKGISNKKFGGLSENHNYNYSTINDSLYQINEIQNNNTNNTNSNMSNKKLISSKNNNNTKNVKISVINAKMSKANYNSNIKYDLSKSTKEVKDLNLNQPVIPPSNETVNRMTFLGLTTINQNKKVIYRMPNNNKKKDTATLKGKNSHRTINRINKYKRKQN